MCNVFLVDILEGEDETVIGPFEQRGWSEVALWSETDPAHDV